MKYKLIVIAAISALLIVVIFAHSSSTSEEKRDRYHQHREAGTIPVFYMNTNNQSFTDKEQLEVSLSLYDDGMEIASTKAFANVRGNSSAFFDKKSYKLNFINDNGDQNKIPLLGMEAHDEWVLNGPFLDKTLMRNYLSMNIAGEIMEYAPNVRFCELYLNNEYNGVYVLMESINRGEGRIDIDRSGKNLPVTAYILRLDRYEDEKIPLDNFTYYSKRIENMMEVIYPASKNITEGQMKYIQKNFSKFEKSLYSYDYKSDNYGYFNFIDVDSFIDYYIINEFSQNYDATALSTYFYRDVRGKIHIGPVWDFNNAYDNYMETSFDGTGFNLHGNTWYFMLFKDEKFVDKVISRYKELRNTVLSEEYLIKYIDEVVLFLGDRVEQNYSVWGYSFIPENLDDRNRLHPMERNLRSYDEAITQLKRYIVKRGNWMDDNIEILKQYCHESRNKKYNH